MFQQAFKNIDDNINMGTFENERFPFPPVAEQKQIVAKLDALSEETQRQADIRECRLHH